MIATLLAIASAMLAGVALITLEYTLNQGENEL